MKKSKKTVTRKNKKAKFFVECIINNKDKEVKKSYFKSTKFDLIDASIIGPPPFKILKKN